MKHRCKICGKLGTNMTQFGKHGWHHVGCVFEAWRAAVKELYGLRRPYCCTVNGTDDDDIFHDCVLDHNRPDECTYAEKGMKREDCKYWVRMG